MVGLRGQPGESQLPPFFSSAPPPLLLYIERICSHTHFGHWYPQVFFCFFFLKKKDKQVIGKKMFGYFAALVSVINNSEFAGFDNTGQQV